MQVEEGNNDFLFVSNLKYEHIRDYCVSLAHSLSKGKTEFLYRKKKKNKSRKIQSRNPIGTSLLHFPGINKTNNNNKKKKLFRRTQRLGFSEVLQNSISFPSSEPYFRR